MTLALLALALGCSRPRSPGPADEPVPWVDPSRCLDPCAGPPAGRLVTIDERGALDPRGAFRLAAEAQPWLEALLRAASAEGASLRVNGAHRGHAEQADLFARSTEAGRYARPGHSEHELGLAVDLDYPGETPPAILAERAHLFGFITSYPRGKERITGFRAEPWHQRFVGVKLAAELKARGLTLQEYLEASPGRGRHGDCGACASPLARAPCEGDGAPRCEGPVLRWCMGGHEVAVDCVASGGACDAASGQCR